MDIALHCRYLLWMLVVFLIDRCNSTKLITVLADGLKWDYFEHFNDLKLDGFDRLERDGVKASHIISVFPANSYNNYYSIMTGTITIYLACVYSYNDCI